LKNRIFFIGCLLIAGLCLTQCKSDDEEEDLNLIKTIAISISGEVGKDGKLMIGQETEVEATVTPEGAMEVIEWKATVEGIVTLTQKSGTNGRRLAVKAEAEGETQIYAVSRTGKVESDKITVTVSVVVVQNPITAISIPNDDINLMLDVDDERVVNVISVTPADSEEAILWKAATAGIVELTSSNNGRTVIVKAVATGTTEIYAESISGGATSSNITVNVEAQQYIDYPLIFLPSAQQTTFVDHGEYVNLTATGGDPRVRTIRITNPLASGSKILFRFEFRNNRISHGAQLMLFDGDDFVRESQYSEPFPHTTEWTQWEFDITNFDFGSSGTHNIGFDYVDNWKEEQNGSTAVGYSIDVRNLHVRVVFDDE